MQWRKKKPIILLSQWGERGRAGNEGDIDRKCFVDIGSHWTEFWVKDVKGSNQESDRGVKKISWGKTEEPNIGKLQVAGEEIVEDSAGSIVRVTIYSANDGDPLKVLSKNKVILYRTILVCYCFEAVI